MDTSETYIKMCEKAKEIQKQHILTNGDFEVRLKYGRGQVEVYHNREMTAHYKPKNHLWLPRQDQLQEMVGGFKAGFVDWFYWRNAVYPHMQDPFSTAWRFTSMEQLWLAFVMKELYQKTWNGEEWITA